MSRSKYDNDFKSQVIDSGLVKQVIRAKKELYYDKLDSFVDNVDGVVYKVDNQGLWYDFITSHEKDNQYDCAFRLIESKKRKILKVREKISALVLSDSAVFLTLTFRDDVLESTSRETRRRYVARFLKSVSGSYAANIDFSPDINREHYHAVITSRVDLKSWKYGFAFAEKVRCHNNDIARVSKYISKLTSHALKVNSTRLIYSRL